MADVLTELVEKRHPESVERIGHRSAKSLVA